MTTRSKRERKCRLGRNGHDKKRRLFVESLERRIVLSGVPGWDVSGLVDPAAPEPIYLKLDGTAGNDSYEVKSTAGNIEFFDKNLPAPGSLGTFSQGEIQAFVGLVNQLEVLSGGAGNNFFGGIRMNGLDGDDTLNATGLLLYPAWLEGGNGVDTLLGGSKNDKLLGGEGIDYLEGGAGNDTLDGGGGNDTLSGGLGDDILEGGAGDDDLFGDDGNDVLRGGDGDDDLYGGPGADQLYGNGGNDRLYTEGFGITANVQYDTVLSGGDGWDRLYPDKAAGALVNFQNLDIEIIWGTALADQIDSSKYSGPGAGGSDTAQIAGINGVRVYGGDGNDTIIGSSLNDQLYGQNNDDVLSGGAGDDRLDGGNGNDVLEGGAGKDELIGGPGLDIVTYANSPAAVQVDLARDDGAVTGNPPVLIDGLPDRAFSTGGDAEGDWIPNAQGNPNDRGDDLILPVDIEGLIGSKFDDLLWGNKALNWIDGGDGNDQIWGRQGNDNLAGSGGDDTIWGGANDDLLDGGAGNDTLLGEGGADMLFGGDGNDRLDGGRDLNALPSAGDLLMGEDGVDTLVVDYIAATGLLEDYYIFGGFEGDVIELRGTINLADPRATFMNKIKARQELILRSMAGESDFGFGDVDRVKFIP